MKLASRCVLLSGLIGLSTPILGQTGGTDVEPGPASTNISRAEGASRGPASTEPSGGDAASHGEADVQLGPEGQLNDDSNTSREAPIDQQSTVGNDGEELRSDPLSLRNALLDVTSRLEALEARLAAGPSGEPLSGETLRRDLTSLTSTVSKLSQSIEDNLASIELLREQVENQRAVMLENSNRLRELALAASGTGESPTLWGNSQPSETARGRYFENVRYRLRIRNNTGQEQPLYVNGVLWSVRNEDWSFVPVPKGPVTVQRPGLDPVELRENEIHWMADQRGFFVEYDLSTNGLPKIGG